MSLIAVVAATTAAGATAWLLLRYTTDEIPASEIAAYPDIVLVWGRLTA